VPVLHLPRCRSQGAFRSSSELASAIRHRAAFAVIRGPHPALRSRSLAVRALPPASRSLRARLLDEVPGFGAVLIARPACVTDRGAGLVADRRSVPEPVAGGEIAVALGACSRSSGESPATSLGCLLDRERSESPVSPHPLHMRLDPEGSRFLLSPHSVPLEFLPVPSGARHAPRNSGSCRGHVRGGRNPMGTRPEPIEDFGPHRRDGGPDGATLRRLRRALLAIRFRIGSITHTKARDGLRP
jgi:hypothetical protein